MREHFAADLDIRHVEPHQLSERYTHELHLPSEHPHRRAMVSGPGDAAMVHQMIALADAMLPPENVGKPQGGVVDVQVLVHGIAVAADHERFSLANPVNPGKIP